MFIEALLLTCGTQCSHFEMPKTMEQLAALLNPLLGYAEEQTGRDRMDLFNEMISFLDPYAGRLDEGIKKYIEFIGGQA